MSEDGDVVCRRLTHRSLGQWTSEKSAVSQDTLFSASTNYLPLRLFVSRGTSLLIRGIFSEASE